MLNFLLIQEMSNSKIKQKTKIRDMINFVNEDLKDQKMKISWTFLISKT